MKLSNYIFIISICISISSYANDIPQLVFYNKSPHKMTVLLLSLQVDAGESIASKRFAKPEPNMIIPEAQNGNASKTLVPLYELNTDEFYDKLIKESEKEDVSDEVIYDSENVLLDNSEDKLIVLQRERMYESLYEKVGLKIFYDNTGVIAQCVVAIKDQEIDLSNIVEQALKGYEKAEYAYPIIVDMLADDVIICHKECVVIT